MVDLSSLSSFATPLGALSLTAQNDGVILLPGSAFLVQNVAVNIPAGHPVLPPTLVASPALTLYGQAWHSYWVEKRDTRFADSPWVFAARVPLTSASQIFASEPPADTAFRVSDFVADPPIVDLCPQPGQQVQLVLYGATNKTYQVESNTNVSASAAWTPGAVAAMTNSFRILAPEAASSPRRFYRAKQL